MLEASPLLVHYPTLPMSRFGLIPGEFGGGTKYRIIWAPSRLITLTGRNKTMTVPMYFGPYAIEPVGESWILEGWKSPADLYSGTAEDWNADPKMLNLGPYPARGDYVRHETLSCNPSDANIEKLISWLEAGGKRRRIENALACRNNLEKTLDDKRKIRRDIIGNRMLAFGADANSGYGGGRNTKTYPLLRSREELGLPAPGATTALKTRNAPVYEIPQEAE